MIACLVPAILPAQRQAGWRFWDVSDGMVESYSMRVGKGPDGRVWVRNGSVRSMSVLDGYSVRTIPEPHSQSLYEYRAMRRVYGGTGQAAWTVVNGELKQFDGRTWKVRLGAEPAAGQMLQALPVGERVLVLYASQLAEFTPASGSLRILKRSSETAIGEFREIVAGFRGEVFVAGATGLGRLLPQQASSWIQCNTSAAGLRNVEHLLPGDAGEVFFSGTVRHGLLQESAAAVWDGAPGGRLEILYRDAHESVRVWRGPDHSLWLLQGSLLYWVVNGRKQPIERTGPLAGTVSDVLAEPDGAFWLTSSDGVAHYTPPTWRTPPAVDGLNEPFGKMTQDAKGRLWFVGSRHLVELDGSAWTIRDLPSNLRDDVNQIACLCMLPGERLAMLAQETEGIEHLLIFDVGKGTFQEVIHPGGRSVSFLSCRSAGGLWIVTAPGTQLETLDGGKFHLVADLSKQWQLGSARWILERGPGDSVLGGNEGAAILQQGHLRTFRPEDGFTESSAFSLSNVGNNQMLACGRQNVLAYDGRRWTKFAANLAPRVARRMRDGTLWVASFTGIHHVRNGVWIANGELEGLPSDHVRNVLEDSQGRIWVATSNGLSLYHPDADQAAPRTVLALARNATQVAPGGRIRISLEGIDQWKRTQPEQLLFAYCLDHGPWQPFTATDHAAFEGLAAGSHQLQVRAMDRNGNADSRGDAVNFVVLVPWYRNASFLVLSGCGLLIILALLFLAAMNYRKLGDLVVQLNRARLAAEYASRCKTEFLANMSHEIRTPMNAIMGMSQLALETPPGEEQKEYLRTVTAASNSLLGLLNDILDLSKVEAGKLKLSAVDFSLQACVAGVIRTFRLRAKEQGVALTSRVHPEVPEFLHGDDQRLRQVLINLAGNALKFTSQGSVSIEVSAISGGRVPGLHFAVRDTGCGVAVHRQAAVFRAFEQGDDSTARTHGGTGLGLAIVTRIVELMGGRIWVESPWTDPITGSRVTGSTFHFETYFTAASAPSAAISPVSSQPIAPLRILLAEDNPVNRLVAMRRLGRDGHKIIVAEDGEEALQILQGESVDLILMDIQMPKLDGFQTTSAIRKWEQSTGKRIPIIALTAHALEGLREQALDAGMDGFVTKPIQFAELRAVIRTVIEAAKQSREEFIRDVV